MVDKEETWETKGENNKLGGEEPKSQSRMVQPMDKRHSSNPKIITH